MCIVVRLQLQANKVVCCAVYVHSLLQEITADPYFAISALVLPSACPQPCLGSLQACISMILNYGISVYFWNLHVHF